MSQWRVNKNMKCLIISGGEYCEAFEELNYDYIIACDKGIEYACKMGIIPHLIMGDFDSFKGQIPSAYSSIPIERFIPHKDDTDTMLAIKKALELGYKDITLTCALGGRLDHTYANLQSLAFIAANGGAGRLYSDRERILTFTGGKLILPRLEGFSLSLFAFSNTCDGLSVQGTEYEVTNISLSNTFPLGISNEWKADRAVITMEKGLLLVIESRMD